MIRPAWIKAGEPCQSEMSQRKEEHRFVETSLTFKRGFPIRLFRKNTFIKDVRLTGAIKSTFPLPKRFIKEAIHDSKYSGTI
jgi:hypothetical protein